jgi:hypothetical protein
MEQAVAQVKYMIEQIMTYPRLNEYEQVAIFYESDKEA